MRIFRPFGFFNFSTLHSMRHSLLAHFAHEIFNQPILLACNPLSDPPQPLFTDRSYGRFWFTSLSPSTCSINNPSPMATRAMRIPIGQWYTDMARAMWWRCAMRMDSVWAMRVLLFLITGVIYTYYFNPNRIYFFKGRNMLPWVAGHTLQPNKSIIWVS